MTRATSSPHQDKSHFRWKCRREIVVISALRQCCTSWTSLARDDDADKHRLLGGVPIGPKIGESERRRQGNALSRRHFRRPKCGFACFDRNRSGRWGAGSGVADDDDGTIRNVHPLGRKEAWRSLMLLLRRLFLSDSNGYETERTILERWILLVVLLQQPR